MQQVHARRIGIGDRNRVSPWRADDYEPANELLSAAWERRVNRQVRIRALFTELAKGRGGRA